MLRKLVTNFSPERTFRNCESHFRTTSPSRQKIHRLRLPLSPTASHLALLFPLLPSWFTEAPCYLTGFVTQHNAARHDATADTYIAVETSPNTLAEEPPTTALCVAPYTVPPHAYRRAFK